MNILDAKKRAKVIYMLEAGLSQAAIHRDTGCDRKTIRSIENDWLASKQQESADGKTLRQQAKSRNTVPIHFQGRIGRCHPCGAKAVLLDGGLCRACLVRSQVSSNRTRRLTTA